MKPSDRPGAAAARTISAGRLVWLTGLAGSGKTTIGRRVVDVLRDNGTPVVFLDGDQLREVFATGRGYGRADRLDLALAYCRLCKLLCDQGVDVVCATISLFSECHAWNRAHVARYVEVFLDVPFDVLVARDQKQLYTRALRGEIRDVVGVDLEFVRPVSPDLILRNDGEITVEALVDRVVQRLREHDAAR